jgi:hypothetical protein
LTELLSRGIITGAMKVALFIIFVESRIMTNTELINLLATIASLVLSVVAIFLSIVFYRLSSEISRSTIEASKGIGASVDRLEKLFDKLYSDTFSMMRDTVSDMRKHMWPDDAVEMDKMAEEVEKRADLKVQTLKKEISDELSAVLKSQRLADEKFAILSGEMNSLLDRVITSSREVEVQAREETLRDAILRTIRILRRSRQNIPTISDLIDKMAQEASASNIIEELMNLRRVGAIDLGNDLIGPHTQIRLKGVGRVPPPPPDEPVS